MNPFTYIFKRTKSEEETSKRSFTNNFTTSQVTVDRLPFAQLKKLNDALGGYNANFDLSQALGKISIVNQSVRLIADNVSKCDLEVIKSDGKTTQQLTNHPLYDQLKYQPSTIFSSKNWLSNLLTVLNLHGNAYYQINSGSLDLIDCDLIDKAEIKGGKIFYSSSKNKTLNLRQDEVLHFKINSDSVFGLSPLKAVNLQVQNFYKSQKNIDSTYSQGMNSRVYLDPIADFKATTEKQDEMIEKIKSESAGYTNAGILVSPFGYNLKSFQIPREDQEILLTSEFSEEAIAAAFFVPILLIKPNPSIAVNLKDLKQLFQEHLINLMAIVEDELNNKLLTIEDRKAGIEIRFNKSKLYVNDLTLMTTPLNTLVTSGIITRNEAREQLGYDHSDEPVMNQFTAQIQNATVDSLTADKHPLLNQNSVDNKLKQPAEAESK